MTSRWRGVCGRRGNKRLRRQVSLGGADHDVERWTEFRKRYRAELAGQPEALAEFRSLARKGPITLLFGAHDEPHNNAVVLRELLAKRVTAQTATKPAGKTRRKT